MIWFCYFSEKANFFVLGVAHGTSFFAQVGWKMVRGFSKIFSELATGFQSEFSIVLIEFP